MMGDLTRREADSAVVANDVAKIFAPLQARHDPAASRTPPGAATHGPSAGRGASYSRLGAAFAAIVVAGTVGAVWVKPLWDDRTRTAAAVAALGSPPSSPVARNAVTLTTEPSRGIEVPTEFTYTPTARPPAAARSVPDSAPAAPPQKSARGLGCRELTGQGRQTCFHAQVMSADRRLRQAYARAGYAGVPRPVMVAYRNRWAGLRREAIRDPDRVVTGYGAMAVELRREARQAERRYGRATG